MRIHNRDEIPPFAAPGMDANERQLMYLYAYQELFIAEIVEETLFLSETQRLCILDCVRALKGAFLSKGDDVIDISDNVEKN